MSLVARAPGILLVLAGVACAIETSTFDVLFMTDPVGPKALPGLVALILTLSGVHATLHPSGDLSHMTRGTLVRTGSASAAFLLYAVALPQIGFFTSTTLVVATLSSLFGAPPRRALLAAALLTAVLWIIFVQGLGLPLPIGDLWIR